MAGRVAVRGGWISASAGICQSACSRRACSMVRPRPPARILGSTRTRSEQSREVCLRTPYLLHTRADLRHQDQADRLANAVVHTQRSEQLARRSDRPGAYRGWFTPKIRSDFRQCPIVVGFIPQWPNIHAHYTVTSSILSYSARVPTNFTSTRLKVYETRITGQYRLPSISKIRRLFPTKSTVAPNFPLTSAGPDHCARLPVACHARSEVSAQR